MFRFTIRDVLWLTVVVAVCCGWWLEHRRFVAYHDRMTLKWDFKFAPLTGGFSRVSVTEDSQEIEKSSEPVQPQSATPDDN